MKTFLLFLSLFISALYTNNAYCQSVKLSLAAVIDSAMNNHPQIKNTNLNENIASAAKQTIFDIHPTTFSYEKGQLFSNVSDSRFEIVQNFGSPVAPFAKAKYVNSQINLIEAESQVIKLQIVIRVKKAYYDCVYKVNRYNLLKKQLELFEGFSEKMTLHHELGNISLLEKTMAEAEYADVQSNVDQAYNDVLLANNLLSQEAYITTEIEPVEQELYMYMVDKSNSATNIYSDYYTSRINLSQAKIKVEQAIFFPEIFAGYFNQSINKNGGFSGWQVGINVPLWFFNQNYKCTEAKTQKLIALNEYEYQDFNNKKNTESLIIELNKLFERLNYFYNNGLKQANTLEKTANQQISSEDIDYSDYLKCMNMALKIKLDYLETLNHYNQKAIELELLSK
jgi:cobalt-zinc-cadmium resistance protein CzcA